MKNLKRNQDTKLGKPRILIFGCGNVGLRLLKLLQHRFRVFAVTSQLSHCAELRAAGAIPLLANLDQPDTLIRLTSLAQTVVHLVPPQPTGTKDWRTRNLVSILPESSVLVYISTTGVYGDCKGELIAETRHPQPNNARAKRRMDAEQVLRKWARRRSGRLAILRVPGIYAGDRLPLQRLQERVPVLQTAEDVYTNHIHADDLAQIIKAAIFRSLPLRIYHASDDTQLKMGEYFDLVAKAFDLPLPPRLSREVLAEQVSPLSLSFMSESRRLQNHRIKLELGVQLTYPNVQTALTMIRNVVKTQQ